MEEIVLLPSTHQNQTEVVSHNVRNLQTSNNNYRDGNFRSKNGIKQLLIWIVFPGFLFLAVSLIILQLSYTLSTVRSRTSASHLFSEERARDHYPNLTEHGSRVIHTRGDFLTRQYLISQLNRIRSTVKMPLRFELDLQNFTVPQIGQLQNIAVRLSNSARENQNVPSLMLAAHYDTVELSPGGSDDGSGIVILLEVLSNLINDPTITFADVHLIVLFTSSEEMYSKGAEAFVTNHTWCTNVRRFITVDAMSGNGNAMLFRVKPTQLVIDYARVPRPHANVISDRVLKFLGAENDYTVFISNGSRFGYDIGFYLDGYMYHTTIDHPSLIEPGSLQLTGTNVLALSRDILLGRVDLQQPKNIMDDEHLIYFDLFNRYLIVYKIRTSIIISSTLVISILIIGGMIICIDHSWHRRRTSPCTDVYCVYFYFKQALVIRIASIIIHFISYSLSLIIGLSLAAIVAWILSKLHPFTWFGSSLLAFFLFGSPCLIGIVATIWLWAICHRFCLSKCSKVSHQIGAIDYRQISQQSFDFERHMGLLLVYGLFMVESMHVDCRLLYIFLFWSIFICPVYIFLLLIEFTLRWKRFYVVPRHYWLPIPFIVSLVPFTHSLDISSRFLRLMIPIAARGLATKPVPREVIICMFAAIPIAISFLIFIPTMQRVMNFARTLSSLSIVFLIVLVVTCIRQPFTANHPKPVSVKHVSQSIYPISNLSAFPFLVPLASRSTTITIRTFDGSPVSSLLDQFSIKSGYALVNRRCSKLTQCTFDDTFNRTDAIQQIEIRPNMNRPGYVVIFRHVSSYQINVSSLSTSFVMHNQSVTPRTETVVELKSLPSSFYLDINIKRCDLSDSPFLMALTRTMPHVVASGGNTCQTITDSAILLSIDR